MSHALELRIGGVVLFQGREFTILKVLGLEKVLAKDMDTGHVATLSIMDCGPLEGQQSETPPMQDLVAILDEDWEIARTRFEIIRPVLNRDTRTRRLVEDRAREHEIHPATIYRWIASWDRTGKLDSLLPSSRCDAGKSRLPVQVEEILHGTIEELYLDKQRRSIQATCNEVSRRCKNAGFKPPHANTVRNRIATVPEWTRVERRRGRKVAEEQLSPKPAAFPGADWPLAVVQMDHTKVDLILVDDQYRHPVGRPWITLAIDVFSRMVTGFYVSFDPPGALATGMCVANSILPKERWLAKHNVAASWPCWGIMKTIHVDNAKEFRGDMLKRACQQYGINLEWRPVKTPHYGGNIERMLGTLLKEIHGLPGTTFSNPKERAEYPSERKAALTLTEFETWLATLITEVYHQRLHTNLGMSPLKKYEEGTLGSPERLGRGLPDRIVDEDRLRLDFMPYEERTIQLDGVVIDKIHYYADVLRRWAKSPSSHSSRRFVFKRDPRDISVVYFFDPELNQYFSIPYRDTSRPPISLWEHREALRRLREQGAKEIDEAAIFDAYARLRELEQASKRMTKKVRRAAQRRSDAHRTERPLSATLASIETNLVPGGAVQSGKQIKPFEDLDEELATHND